MPLLRFGTFELDVEGGELRRQGRLVHLTGQPFMTLAYLAQRRGALVTRDELRRHIWGDSRFVDFDRNLNFCIAAVRAALHDNPRSPVFIETVPRRGYRFIAAVTSLSPASVAAVTPLERWGRSRRPWRRLAAVAAVLPLLLMHGEPAQRAHTRATADPLALAAFEHGLDETSQGVSGRRRAIASFRRAIRIDPKFAEAHFALADAYLDLAGARALPIDAALTEARDAALRAIALEDVADTRTVLGMVRLLRDRDWSGARRELDRSLAAQPESDGTLVAYARVLSAGGDHGRAIAMIDRAEAISPSCDLVLWESALIRYRAHRGAEALEKVRLAAELGPPDGVAERDWATRTAWLRVLVHADRGEWTLAALAAADIGDGIPAGDPQRALRTFAARAADATAHAASDPSWTATLYALAGDRGAALSWLERAARDRDPGLLFALRNPAFDALRGDDRFRRLALS